MAGKLDQELQRAFVIDDFETMKVFVRQGIDVNSVDARDGRSIMLRSVMGQMSIYESRMEDRYSNFTEFR
jgi:hypothetical protein